MRGPRRAITRSPETVSPYELGGTGNSGGGASFPALAPGEPYGPWQSLCSWSASRRGVAIPLILSTQLNAEIPAGGLGVPVSIRAFAAGGASYGALAPVNALWAEMRVQYGVNGSVRERLIDVRDGTYQLPPCDFFRADVRARNLSAVASNPFTVLASVAPGDGRPGDWATNGFAVLYAGAPAAVISFSQRGVKYARWSFLNGAGQDIQAELGGGQPEVVLDLSVPTYVPQVPDIADMGTGAFFANLSGAGNAPVYVEQLVSF